MTEVELRQQERELANQEEELQGYAREILERERAVQVAEEKLSKNSDIERTDYLFDAINKHQRPPVVVVEPTVRTKVDSPMDCLTAFMATLAAITSLVVLILIVV